MSKTLKHYLDSIRRSLENVLHFQLSPGEKQNRPDVEICDKETKTIDIIEANANERSEYRCLIESTRNSVRISFRFKYEASDPVEQLLGKKFLGFMMKRAEEFLILRRVPIEGYSISFLICPEHLELFSKAKIVSFILHFVEDADSEISELKCDMNARGRSIAFAHMSMFG